MNFINYVYLIFGLTAFCLTWTNFSPIQDKIKLLYNLPGKLWHKIAELLTCTKCFSIWLCVFFLSFCRKDLDFTEIIAISCGVSIIANYLSFYTNKTRI